MKKLFLRVSGCVSDSIVDGPGMRFVVFVQGCPHHCPDCHNPQTHSFAAGELIDTQKIVDAVLENPLAKGITFSGGEPFCQAKILCQIGKQVAATGKDIVVYTGYTIEELLKMRKQDAAIETLLAMTDLLIDGRYERSQRDLTLQFRGSKNQRLISREMIAAALAQP